MTVLGESAAFQFSHLLDYDRHVLVRGLFVRALDMSSTGNSLAQVLEKLSFP